MLASMSMIVDEYEYDCRGEYESGWVCFEEVFSPRSLSTRSLYSLYCLVSASQYTHTYM